MKEEKLLVRLYVDDMLVNGSNTDLISEFKSQMLSEFEMSGDSFFLSPLKLA